MQKHRVPNFRHPCTVHQSKYNAKNAHTRRTQITGTTSRIVSSDRLRRCAGSRGRMYIAICRNHNNEWIAATIYKQIEDIQQRFIILSIPGTDLEFFHITFQDHRHLGQLVDFTWSAASWRLLANQPSFGPFCMLPFHLVIACLDPVVPPFYVAQITSGPFNFRVQRNRPVDVS